MKNGHKVCVRMNGTQFLWLWWFTAKNHSTQAFQPAVYVQKYRPFSFLISISILARTYVRKQYLLYLQLYCKKVFLLIDLHLQLYSVCNCKSSQGPQIREQMSRDFIIWKINSGLWAVVWAGLWNKRVWADYEQLLRPVFLKLKLKLILIFFLKVF